MKATLLEQWEEGRRVWADTETLLPMLGEVCGKTVACLKNGGTIFTCGNGGSGADALHMTEEFVGRYKFNRRPLPSICLSADTPLLTCIGNDFGFDYIFSRPLEAFAKKGDMLFGFTTSGNSKNIVEAFAQAKKMGVTTILMSGKDGGACAPLSDIPLIVPSQTTARIQELHNFFFHSILEAVEDAFPPL